MPPTLGEIVGLLLGACILVNITFLFLVVMTPRAEAAEMCGLASYYGPESGSRTASGERFDGTSLTAAMAPRFMGQRFRVHYGNKHVDVRINDTGGFAKYGRIIDLSVAVARRLGTINAGVARICLELLK